MPRATTSDDLSRRLCLACGICCNGVLFRDVEMQAGDDPAALRALSMPMERCRPEGAPPQNSDALRWRITQPCAALGPDCRCRIYADRPSRCRMFECDLFRKVLSGRRAVPAALRVIRDTMDKAERAKALLRQLGDTEETLALSLRFQRLQTIMNCRRLTEESAAAYADLTLAVHDLNLILGGEFHP